MQLREASAASADVHQKLQNAAQQMRRATHELEQAFEPAHRALTNEFGEQEGEVFYDPAGRLFAKFLHWKPSGRHPLHAPSIRLASAGTSEASIHQCRSLQAI